MLISLALWVVFATINALIFLWFRASAEWILSAVLLSLVGAFVLDWIAAWNGIYTRFSGISLVGLLVMSAVGINSVARVVGTDETDAAYLTVGLIVLMGFFEGLEHVYIQARTVLRVFRGLRTSGDIQSAIVVAATDPEVVERLGADSFEGRLRVELEDLAEDQQVISFTPKAETDFGYNVQRVGAVRTLFRIENGLFEALCVPQDGVVARFEKADKPVRSLQFIAEQILHLARPSPERIQEAQSNLRAVYSRYAAPTFDLRQLRRSIDETWRIRKGAILASILALVVAFGGLFAILNATDVVTFLVDPRTNMAAATVFYIGGILALIAASVRYLWKRLGRRTSK